MSTNRHADRTALAQGRTCSHCNVLALDAALGSCAPGLTVVNIGNGFGAACAAIRIIRAGAVP